MENKTATSFVLLSLFIVALLFPVELCAEVYKYIDKDGTIHFVTDLGKVPREYRHQVIVRESLDEEKPIKKAENPILIGTKEKAIYEFNENTKEWVLIITDHTGPQKLYFIFCAGTVGAGQIKGV